MGPTTCGVPMDGGWFVQGVPQEVLEPASRRLRRLTVMLYGTHEGAYGVLVDRDVLEGTGVVRDAAISSACSSSRLPRWTPELFWILIPPSKTHRDEQVNTLIHHVSSNTHCEENSANQSKIFALLLDFATRTRVDKKEAQTYMYHDAYKHSSSCGPKSLRESSFGNAELNW